MFEMCDCNILLVMATLMLEIHEEYLFKNLTKQNCTTHLTSSLLVQYFKEIYMILCPNSTTLTQ